jgi:hypothetical protein
MKERATMTRTTREVKAAKAKPERRTTVGKRGAHPTSGGAVGATQRKLGKGMLGGFAVKVG